VPIYWPDCAGDAYAGLILYELVVFYHYVRFCIFVPVIIVFVYFLVIVWLSCN